jgi:GT2 family glycosyltransferase
MITASIVTYHNSEFDIEKVLQSVIDSCIDKIYLVDQSETDLYRHFENRSPKIRYLHNTNNGYGSGNNIAIVQAMKVDHSIYHIVLNPDIHFEKNTIEEIVKYMDLNNDVGLVMPKVFYPNGEIQYLCKLIPTPIDILFRRFLSHSKFKNRDRRFNLLFTDYNKAINIPYLSGCFMFLRVSALKKVGLFDERFFMHFEDLDLSRRIHEHYRTMYYPSAQIVHAHAASHRVRFKMLKISFINAVKYFNKWGWFFDSKRTLTNIKILNELGYNKNECKC